MAKIILNAPLLATITGPTRSTRWRTLPSGQAQIKGGPTGTHKSTARYGWPGSPYLTLPATWSSECAAWKMADAQYTNFSGPHKYDFRCKNTKPGTSPYDAWMKQALPHYLRGMYCPMYWQPTVAWSLHKLHWNLHTLANETFVPRYMQPPDVCKTFGLWYANVRFTHTFVSYPGGTYPRTDSDVIFGYTTLWPVAPDRGFATLRFAEFPPDQPPGPHDLTLGPMEISYAFRELGSCWQANFRYNLAHFHYLSITIQDYIRDNLGAPTLPHHPHFRLMCTVEWLDGRLAWTHWQQAWPTKKHPRTWTPIGWPSP